MMESLEEGRTINGAYYAEELRRLLLEIVKKRRGTLTRGVMFLPSNAPAHILKLLWLLRLNAALRSFLIPSLTADLQLRISAQPQNFCKDSS